MLNLVGSNIMTKKCYSTDGELFETDFSVVSENIEVGDEYEEADAVPYTSEKFIDCQLDSILEEFDARAWDDIGECYGNTFSTVKFSNPEAYEELKSYLTNWVRWHSDIENFFEVKNVVKKVLTQDDIE